MTMETDKYTADFWRGVKVGQTLCLSDEQAIEDAMESKTADLEMNYIIDSIRIIKHEETGIEWRFLQLRSDDNMWLLVKIVDKEFDLRIYFEPDDFEQGNRADMIENECHWVFEEPEDTDDFELNDLEFAKTFEMCEAEYTIKRFGMLCGVIQCQPSNRGVDGSMTCIAEYQTDADTKNTEIIFLEIGGEEDDDGGFIQMLLGTPINQQEVEVL